MTVDNASPALQVVPAIDAHFRDAYAMWQTAATALQSAHDAVAARYMRSVTEWLRYKPTLVALAHAPLMPRHWHELWHYMNTPYVRGFTLGDLIKRNAFEHTEVICALVGVAADEFALEAQMEVSSASPRALPLRNAPDVCVHESAATRWAIRPTKARHAAPRHPCARVAGTAATDQRACKQRDHRRRGAPHGMHTPIHTHRRARAHAHVPTHTRTHTQTHTRTHTRCARTRCARLPPRRA